MSHLNFLFLVTFLTAVCLLFDSCLFTFDSDLFTIWILCAHHRMSFYAFLEPKFTCLGSIRSQICKKRPFSDFQTLRQNRNYLRYVHIFEDIKILFGVLIATNPKFPTFLITMRRFMNHR